MGMLTSAEVQAEQVQPNLDNIRAWVAALRSGKYTQGRGALIRVEWDGDKYCCLGVACEVALEAGVALEHQVLGSYHYFSGGNTGVLPAAVARWLGVLTTNPLLRVPPHLVKAGMGDPETAISLNDQRKFTFEQIAEAIEYTFLKEEPQHGTE